jgi:PTH2 family peptidyl-tRNA hydrolase
MKQVIAARTDLGMGRGKLAAQVAHASLMAYEAADDDARRAWKREGQKKIVVKVRGESALRDLAEQAYRAGLPCELVEDAGLTQLEPGTPTAVGIGPAPEREVDRLTGDYTLY